MAALHIIDINFYDATECLIHKKFVFTVSHDGIYTHTEEDRETGAKHDYFFYSRREMRDWIECLWDTDRIAIY